MAIVRLLQYAPSMRTAKQTTLHPSTRSRLVTGLDPGFAGWRSIGRLSRIRFVSKRSIDTMVARCPSSACHGELTLETSASHRRYQQGAPVAHLSRQAGFEGRSRHLARGCAVDRQRPQHAAVAFRRGAGQGDAGQTGSPAQQYRLGGRMCRSPSRWSSTGMTPCWNRSTKAASSSDWRSAPSLLGLGAGTAWFLGEAEEAAAKNAAGRPGRARHALDGRARLCRQGRQPAARAATTSAASPWTRSSATKRCKSGRCRSSVLNDVEFTRDTGAWTEE